MTETGEASVSTGYQGETLQVFIFFRGQYLGYQCYAQDRVIVGANRDMDLYLPACSEEDGYRGFFVAKDVLYTWHRAPGAGPGGGNEEAPQAVQPLDTFRVGDYHLQVRLLRSQSFTLHCMELGMDLGEEMVAAAGAEEPHEAEVGQEAGPQETEPVPEPEAEDAIQRDLFQVVEAPREPVPTAGEGAATGIPEEVSAPEPPAAERQVEEKAAAGEPAAEVAPETVPAASEHRVELMDSREIEEFWACWDDVVSEETAAPEVASAWEETDAIETDPVESAPAADPLAWAPPTEVPPIPEPVGAEPVETVPREMGVHEEAPVEAAPRNVETVETPVGTVASAPSEEPEASDEPEEVPEADPEVKMRGPEEPLSAGEAEPMDRELMPMSWRVEAPSVPERPGGEPPETPAAGAAPSAAVEMECAEDGEEDPDDDEIEYLREEESEEEDESVRYFNLLREMFPRPSQPASELDPSERSLEVVRFHGCEVDDITCLDETGAYTVRRGWTRRMWKREGGLRPDFKLVRYRKGSVAELAVQEGVQGRLHSGKGVRDLWGLMPQRPKRLRSRTGFRLTLPADAWAVLQVDAERYLVRYVPRRPGPSVTPMRPNLNRSQFKLFSASVLSHLVLIFVIGVVVPERTLEGYSRTDQFARVDPEALKVLEPLPPPKPVEPVKPKVQPKRAKVKVKPKATRKVVRPMPSKASAKGPRQAGGGGGGKKEVDVAQAGLLGALGGPDSGVLNGTGQSAVLLAAVTNLDAVSVPAGATTFNLAGVAGKLASSEIQVPTSEVIRTMGASELIKKGDGTLGALASKGSGQVRGVVREPPKAKISIRGGMSREAVLRVVNEHLDQIRDCYERELLHSPGINGKILMEWLIQADGSVRYAKTKFTNIGHSSDLHICIQSQVTGWTFPRPTGGQEVLVTFPFLFESMGF